MLWFTLKVHTNLKIKFWSNSSKSLNTKVVKVRVGKDRNARQAWDKILGNKTATECMEQSFSVPNNLATCNIYPISTILGMILYPWSSIIYIFWS